MKSPGLPGQPLLPTGWVPWSVLQAAASCEFISCSLKTIKHIKGICLHNIWKTWKASGTATQNLWRQKQKSMMESYLMYKNWKGEKDNPESYSNFYRYNLYLSFSRWERWHTRNGSLNSSVKPGKLASCCASHLSLILWERVTGGGGGEGTAQRTCQPGTPWTGFKLTKGRKA